MVCCFDANRVNKVCKGIYLVLYISMSVSYLNEVGQLIMF